MSVLSFSQKLQWIRKFNEKNSFFLKRKSRDLSNSQKKKLSLCKSILFKDSTRNPNFQIHIAKKINLGRNNYLIWFMYVHSTKYKVFHQETVWQFEFLNFLRTWTAQQPFLGPESRCIISFAIAVKNLLRIYLPRTIRASRILRIMNFTASFVMWSLILPSGLNRRECLILWFSARLASDDGLLDSDLMSVKIKVRIRIFH